MKRVVGVVGLGYVGLPVALAFGRNSRTIGFDISRERVQALKEGNDHTWEISSSEIKSSDILFTNSLKVLKKANFYIVAVPTPVDSMHRPDLSPVISASEIVGKVLKKGDLVVYESTVYPGVTEEECLPILERVSGLKGGKDFKVGYSPERINPGDKQHVFSKIRKVVSGQDSESLEIIAQMYGSVVEAGIFKASSIKVAEAAKVIENTQRDLNIAFVNELAIIFRLLGIDTSEVLEAAGTKWNFIRFKPGLVGGHCIGVDPYYLTHKAEQLGYVPQVILAGRRINDGMGKYIAQETVKLMIKSGHRVLSNTVTVLGMAFKENCRDIRNSKVFDIIRELRDHGLTVQVADPMVDKRMVYEEYGLHLVDVGMLKPADSVILAVGHDHFKKISKGEFMKLFKKKSPILIDVKSVLDPGNFKDMGVHLWRL